MGDGRGRDVSVEQARFLVHPAVAALRCVLLTLADGILCDPTLSVEAALVARED